jgi:hypothetical protein
MVAGGGSARLQSSLTNASSETEKLARACGEGNRQPGLKLADVIGGIERQVAAVNDGLFRSLTKIPVFLFSLIALLANQIETQFTVLADSYASMVGWSIVNGCFYFYLATKLTSIYRLSGISEVDYLSMRSSYLVPKRFDSALSRELTETVNLYKRRGWSVNEPVRFYIEGTLDLAIKRIVKTGARTNSYLCAVELVYLAGILFYLCFKLLEVSHSI